MAVRIDLVQTVPLFMGCLLLAMAGLCTHKAQLCPLASFDGTSAYCQQYIYIAALHLAWCTSPVVMCLIARSPQDIQSSFCVPLCILVYIWTFYILQFCCQGQKPFGSDWVNFLLLRCLIQGPANWLISWIWCVGAGRDFHFQSLAPCPTHQTKNLISSWKLTQTLPCSVWSEQCRDAILCNYWLGISPGTRMQQGCQC